MPYRPVIRIVRPSIQPATAGNSGQKCRSRPRLNVSMLSTSSRPPSDGRLQITARSSFLSQEVVYVKVMRLPSSRRRMVGEHGGRLRTRRCDETTGNSSMASPGTANRSYWFFVGNHRLRIEGLFRSVLRLPGTHAINALNRAHSFLSVFLPIHRRDNSKLL